MKKNTVIYIAAAIAMPVLTLLVWLIWIFVIPAFKARFLDFVSRHVEKTLYGEKAKTAKKNRRNARKPYGKR